MGWVGVVLAVVGCTTSPPTSFYTLTPTAPSSAPPTARRTLIAVGPVDVSAYLDRSQIVVREDATRLSLADFDQWAEPLGRNIASVVAENLRALLPSAQPIVQPWSDLQSDYQVVIKVVRFDSDRRGRVRLRASWAVVDGKERRYRAVRHADITTQARGTDYEDIALAMSEAVRRLSEEIAAALREAGTDR